jgi:hypothetical protein
LLGLHELDWGDVIGKRTSVILFWFVSEWLPESMNLGGLF